MTTSPTQTHDARHANRRLLVEQIRNDGLDAVLARMTGEEFKEFKVFVVAALLGKLDNQSTSPNVEAPRAWNDVSSVQTEVERTSEAAGLAEEIEGHCQQRQSAGLGLLGRSSMGGREFTIDEQNMVVAALRAFVPP